MNTQDALAQQIALKIQMHWKYSEMHERFSLDISDVLSITTSEIETQGSTESPQYIIAAEVNSQHNIEWTVKDAMILYDWYSNRLEKYADIVDNKFVLLKTRQEYSGTNQESIIIDRLNTINWIVNEAIKHEYQNNN